MSELTDEGCTKVGTVLGATEALMTNTSDRGSAGTGMMIMRAVQRVARKD